MITNSELTIYHKTFNSTTRLEEWVRYNYNQIWWYGGKGASTNKGYENANDVVIRIPYKLNDNLNINNFAIGDAICKGNVVEDISNILSEEKIEHYNIISITNNLTGTEPHIHIEGK